MSKSLGNTIVPGKVINQMGADILRLEKELICMAQRH
jgi:isoleucyl-tRNA synthetase